MNPSSKICACAIALTLMPAVASAEAPTTVAWAKQRVREGLVVPLTQQESGRSKFSRGAQPAQERRVRVLQATLAKDSNGRAFASYEIDARYGEDWESAYVVGCVYRQTGKIYVKRGDEYVPAEYLLGKDVEAVAGVCEAGEQA